MLSLLAGDRSDVHSLGRRVAPVPDTIGRSRGNRGARPTTRRRSQMSTTPAVDAAVLQTLTDGFAGRILLGSEDDYDGARRVHNGLIDRRPAVVAQCVGAAGGAAGGGVGTASGA